MGIPKTATFLFLALPISLILLSSSCLAAQAPSPAPAECATHNETVVREICHESSNRGDPRSACIRVACSALQGLGNISKALSGLEGKQLSGDDYLTVGSCYAGVMRAKLKVKQALIEGPRQAPFQYYDDPGDRYSVAKFFLDSCTVQEPNPNLHELGVAYDSVAALLDGASDLCVHQDYFD